VQCQAENQTPPLDYLALFERMLLIRRAEERLSRACQEGKLPGAVHLYIGQEAVAVGACSALEERDWITSTHRGHGHFLAKGGELKAMYAEIWGKRTGICCGMGGSMHVADFSKGILGANGIVGGGFAIATGAGGSNAAQHSDSAHPALMSFGGINVAMPSNSADAKGLLKTAAQRSPNSCFFLEASARGGQLGEVPDVPFGQASLAREGQDVSIVTVGSMVKPSLEAASRLAELGVSAEVLDLRTVVPIDERAILASIAKTGRMVVVDESRDRCGENPHGSAEHPEAVMCRAMSEDHR
jgi:Transketolase, C-terminal domain/Dehydrogenase E1 component